MSPLGNNHRPDADPGREWSDAELYELDDMLVRGLSIEEIAHSLRRQSTSPGGQPRDAATLL